MIIHRDLKPDNIMIRNNPHSDFHCVLIDFGLGTLAHAPSYLFSRCGTPGFLSPEIANLNDKKTKQSCRSDMFSLGCIFYKMYTTTHSVSQVTISSLEKLQSKSCRKTEDANTPSAISKH
jgi:serine/threonine protein kinase